MIKEYYDKRILRQVVYLSVPSFIKDKSPEIIIIDISVTINVLTGVK